MRIALMLLLGLAATPALAQWVKIDGKDNAVHYIDRATLTRNGDMRRVWVTQFLREKGIDGELSRRALLEYDCAGRRFRYLSIAKHSAKSPVAQARPPENAQAKATYIPAPIDENTVQSVVCAP